MFTKKQLIITSFALAVLFHFIFHFDLYGPSIGLFKGYPKYLLAIFSALLMIFVYFTTHWRLAIKENFVKAMFDIMIFWIFICFIRSLIGMNSSSEIIGYLFNNYVGISLFPVFFFIAGNNVNYFGTINKILTVYINLAST